MFDAIETLAQLNDGLEKSKGVINAAISAQQAAMDAIEAPGVLDAKTKLLVAIGAIAYTRCENCVALHMPKVVAAGVTKAEVMEAAAMAICFGGGPSMAFVGTVIGPAYDQFAAVADDAEGASGSGLFG
ncbi:MAG: carboxymuconolactone decarboxylase family protein [Actinomycetes bacterium]